MITQTAIGLNSRSNINILDKRGFLPLITAPMYSVINHKNADVFRKSGINVCLPRGSWDYKTNDEDWCAVSLEEFNTIFDWKSKGLYPNNIVEKICIDTANGNMPMLHDAIRKAKEIHGDKLIIMAGNVGSVEAFIELAKTGVDYIRVGIGGGGGCNTTSNTGVGQENLEELIKRCVHSQQTLIPYFLKKLVKQQQENTDLYKWMLVPNVINCTESEYKNFKKVKIVADGISTYIKQCENKYGWNDNGYAAINSLLFAGADLVMIGGLFAQCVESAGEKGFQNFYGVQTFEQWNTERKQFGLFNMLSYDSFEEVFKSRKDKQGMLVKYAGMSTLEEQKKYKNKKQIHSNSSTVYGVDFKPSEGSVKWIPVRWTLKEWLSGSDNQDEYPYLMGWVNSYKSAKSYANTEINT